MDNFTIYPVLWDYKKNEKQLYSIKIAVTVDRKTTYILTTHRIHPWQWDEVEMVASDGTKYTIRQVVEHPNSKWINADIQRIISAKQKDLITLNTQGAALNKDAILGPVMRAGKTFKAFATEIREHRVDLPRFLNFAGDGVRLREIDPAMLRRFEKHERERVDEHGNRCVNDNTISCTMKYIGQIMRQAAKEKLIQSNPFDAYTPPVYIDPERIWLEEEEKDLLFKFVDSDPHPMLKTTAVYLLLACYSGIRHSDWGKFDPDTMVRDGLLRLRATKNKQDVVMPVGPTLAKVIEMVRLAGRPYCLEKCNVHLKVIGPAAGIKKVLSTHVGRHSFGYLCASLGLPKSVTAELMGVTVNTVEVYYHLTGQNILKQAAAMSGV